MKRKQIKETINRLCELLEIPVPTLTIDDAFFTDNGLEIDYAFDAEDYSIHIRASAKDESQVDYLTPEQSAMYGLAHEVRHAWQFQREGIDPFAALENLSARERNRTRIEIDANAFATYFQFLLYGIDKINDIPNHKRIDERMGEIMRTETWQGRVEKYFSTLPRKIRFSGKLL